MVTWFQSIITNEYVRLLDESLEFPVYHQASGEDSTKLNTQFEVDKAEIGNRKVNIKSLQNNKYWVVKSADPSKPWIVADAVQPNEDLENPLCTLFEIQPVDPVSNTVRILHCQLKHFASLHPVSGEYPNCLSASSAAADPSNRDVFKQIT